MRQIKLNFLKKATFYSALPSSSPFFILLLLFLLGGCSEQMLTMKSLADNQCETDKYVAAQTELFNKLKDNVVNNHLKKGTIKKVILSRYGQPILCKNIDNTEAVNQECLWRHPTRFFSTDMIYLGFDKNDKLSSWRIEPAS